MQGKFWYAICMQIELHYYTIELTFVIMFILWCDVVDGGGMKYEVTRRMIGFC